ncbi:MAG TPA: hypothetical protein VIY73_20355 [Polyangiaceae bacterium]
MKAISHVGTTVGVQGAGATGGAAATGDESSLLPEPTFSGGNSVTALAALMLQADEQDQKNADLTQSSADQAMAADDANRVAALRDKASNDWAQGLSSGLCEIGGAVLSGVAAFLPSSNGSVDRGSAGAANAAGKAAATSGTIIAAHYKSKADDDDADAAQFQSTSDADKRRSDSAQSQSQAASDSIQKVEQFLQALLQTQQATALKAAGAAG